MAPGAPRRDNQHAVPASILIIDDHQGFRACARRMLEREGYSVVAEAGDAAEGLRRARELRPRLALVDVCLPDLDGLELAAKLRELDEPPVVVLTSGRDCSELQPLAADSGACGVVPKEQLSREAIEALL
jgi:DNA-binding NarL/FixJ family response regulator